MEPPAKGAISHRLWVLSKHTSCLECQHKSEGHWASIYVVQIINHLDQRGSKIITWVYKNTNAISTLKSICGGFKIVIRKYLNIIWLHPL